MANVNFNTSPTYPNVDLNKQSDVKSSGKTNASSNFKKNINVLKNTSKHTLIPPSLDQATGGASSEVSLADRLSEVSLADRLMGGAPPSYEETVKNDAENELATVINTTPVSSEKEDVLQKPITDEMMRFVARQLAIPSKDIIFKALLEKQSGFDKLDEQAQNQLVEQAMEEYLAL